MRKLANIAQSLGNQMRVIGDDLAQFVDLGGRHLKTWRADTDRGEDVAGLVMNRCADATQARLVFTVINGKAALAGCRQFFSEFCRIGDRGFGELLQPRICNALHNIFGLVGENRLAHAGAIGGGVFDHGIGHVRVGFGALDNDGAQPVKYSQVHSAVGEPVQGFNDGVPFAMQFEISKGNASQLKELQPKAIGIAFPVLLDKADLAHCGEQTMGSRAGVSGLSANFRKGERALVGGKTIEYPRDFGQRFDAAVALRGLARLGRSGVIGHSVCPSALFGRLAWPPKAVQSLNLFNGFPQVRPGDAL